MKNELYFNGHDADDNWGIVMGYGSFASLVCPPPAKDYVTNESRTASGKQYLTELARFNERSIALNLYIRAKDRTAFYRKIEAFSSEVLAKGKILLTTKYQPNIVYKCVYKNISQLTEYNSKAAKFVLSLTECNPEDRGREIVRANVSQGDSTIELQSAMSFDLDVTLRVFVIGITRMFVVNFTIPRGQISYNFADEWDEVFDPYIQQGYTTMRINEAVFGLEESSPYQVIATIN